MERLPSSLRVGRLDLASVVAEVEDESLSSSLPTDLLFHVFMRLSVVDHILVSWVCRQWRSVARLAFQSRLLDLNILLLDTHFNAARAARFFALISQSFRVAGLRLSPELASAERASVAQYLMPLRKDFGASIRHLDLTGVPVSNAELSIIPKTVYARLRSLLVAPDEEVISLISLAPVSGNCRNLLHLRWQGFVVLKYELLHRLLAAGNPLHTLKLEAHRNGWRLQNEHLRVLSMKWSRRFVPFWRELWLAYGQFSWDPFRELIISRGQGLVHLNLHGTSVFGVDPVELSRLLVGECPMLETFHAPLDCCWLAWEILFSGLKCLEWMENEVFGRITTASLAIRGNGLDMADMASMDLDLIDYLWADVLDLKFFDSHFVAAGLFSRLQHRSLAARLVPNLSVGVLEWICMERAVISHYFEFDKMNLVPVFQLA